MTNCFNVKLKKQKLTIYWADRIIYMNFSAYKKHTLNSKDTNKVKREIKKDITC